MGGILCAEVTELHQCNSDGFMKAELCEYVGDYSIHLHALLEYAKNLNVNSNLGKAMLWHSVWTTTASEKNKNQLSILDFIHRYSPCTLR